MGPNQAVHRHTQDARNTIEVSTWNRHRSTGHGGKAILLGGCPPLVWNRRRWQYYRPHTHPAHWKPDGSDRRSSSPSHIRCVRFFICCNSTTIPCWERGERGGLDAVLSYFMDLWMRPSEIAWVKKNTNANGIIDPSAISLSNHYSINHLSRIIGH